MQQGFISKTVLITGGTSGIGKASAELFAKRGARVIVTGRNEARGNEALIELLTTSKLVEFVQSDVSTLDGVRKLIEKVTEITDGKIDVLVNNAGFAGMGPTVGTKEEDFDKIFNTNVKAAFYLVEAFVTGMVDRKSGVVVNVSTMVSEFGMPGMAAYGASKAALNLLTKSWAAEFGSSSVRFNAVAPGPVRTPGTEAMGDMLDQLAATAPASRPGMPEEIAAAIVFLASDESSFIQGAILPVDGGKTAI
jgi:NAD(P)-dependent dehydrogenase (short-subunit alcohol dehydrogenase family)